MLQEVICISKRNDIQGQIEIGNTYYLDVETVNGDLDGDWYGNIYECNSDHIYIYCGCLKLNHFKSKI